VLAPAKPTGARRTRLKRRARRLRQVRGSLIDWINFGDQIWLRLRLWVLILVPSLVITMCAASAVVLVYADVLKNLVIAVLAIPWIFLGPCVTSVVAVEAAKGTYRSLAHCIVKAITIVPSMIGVLALHFVLTRSFLFVFGSLFGQVGELLGSPISWYVTVRTVFLAPYVVADGVLDPTKAIAISWQLSRGNVIRLGLGVPFVGFFARFWRLMFFYPAILAAAYVTLADQAGLLDDDRTR